MLKLLHTADWHLGATLQGWPREKELRAALEQVAAIARAHEVDAVVVAGDVFDSLNPSAEAQRLLYETLRDLRAACPKATIALIAGNHDPAGRLEAPRALFDLAGVVSAGIVARPLDIGAHLTPLRDKSGKIGAHLLCVPYPHVGYLPRPPEGAPGSLVVAAVRELYREMIAAAREKIGDGPLVVTGHLHVAGGLESEGAERRILVGGEHAAPCDIFPEGLSYVALGHLHRPQSVGRKTVRYSGSLIPMSKTEIGYAHGVSLVSLDADGAVKVEHVPLTRSVAHLRVPAAGALAFGEVEDAFAMLALDPAAALEERPFVHLAVRVDGPAVGLKADIDALAERFPLRLVSMSVERPGAAAGEAPLCAAARLSERQPVELFREAFLRAHGAPPTSEHARLFELLSLMED